MLVKKCLCSKKFCVTIDTFIKGLLKLAHFIYDLNDPD